MMYTVATAWRSKVTPNNYGMLSRSRMTDWTANELQRELLLPNFDPVISEASPVPTQRPYVYEMEFPNVQRGEIYLGIFVGRWGVHTRRVYGERHVSVKFEERMNDTLSPSRTSTALNYPGIPKTHCTSISFLAIDNKTEICVSGAGMRSIARLAAASLFFIGRRRHRTRKSHKQLDF